MPRSSSTASRRDTPLVARRGFSGPWADGLPRRGPPRLNAIGSRHEDPRRRRVRSRQAARRSRRSSSRARRPARCWSRSRRPASATPTSSRARAPTPRACSRSIFGHEGAGVVVEVGPGVTSLQPRRSRDPALHARVPRVQVVPVAQDEPVHRDPRDAGQGPDARRHEPLLARAARRSTTTWAARRSRTTPCCPRSRSRRSARTRRSTRSATSAAASRPASARCSTPRRSSPARTSSCSASAASASTSSRARAWSGADKIVGVDINPAREALGRAASA